MAKPKSNGYLSAKNENMRFKETFKGETFDKPIRFPKELGAEHPFDFKDLEKLYKKYGLVSAIVNKYADSIVSDFSVKLDNPNAQALVDDFLHDTNFITVMRAWLREGILKGNGFIELDLEKTKIRVMNANNMYVKRNKKGKVLKYHQWTGDLNRFNRDSKKLIPFEPNEIAHIPINKMPNDPYGIGYIYPNERIIENLIKNEQDLQKLSERKSGAPYHVKVGQPGTVTNPAVVDKVKQNLDFMNNRTEWVTDGDVEITAVEFKGVTDNLVKANEYWFHQVIAGTETPEVLLGSGQLNEGIADVQLDSRLTKIKSIQEQVEQIVEEKIIRPFLRANGLDEQPEFKWNSPSAKEINERLTKVKEAMSSPTISENLKRMLEIEYARLMNFEEDQIDMLRLPELGLDDKIEQEEKENEEREREEKIKQPETPGAKPRANQKACTHLNESDTEMTVKEWIELREIAGFNYTDYLVKILQELRKDPFTDLVALTEQDVIDGLLPKIEVDKLRETLNDGFKNNKTIKQIENDVRENVDLKDRIAEGKLILSKEARPNNIARTETVRLANNALESLYKENNIKEVRFLSALSQRTCPICDGLNGQVFNINELVTGTNKPPIHPSCRCTIVGLTG